MQQRARFVISRSTPTTRIPLPEPVALLCRATISGVSSCRGAARDEVFPVDVVLEAMDRQGLLRDVTEIFSRERINVTAANTLTRNSATRMAFTLEVRSLEALTRALALVKDVKGVLAAERR